MDRRLLAALLAASLLGACGGEQPGEAPAASEADAASAPAITPVTPLDYANPASWICRPGADEPCRQPAMATVVAASGQTSRDGFEMAGDPPVDCFYLYPTVSRDASGNADKTAGPEEREIVRQQLARFGNTCRLYAPLYRQATLTALQKLQAGEDAGIDREMAYADVKAAWERYLIHDNQGRGIVLIGHSQGAGLLTRLIAAEIEGSPAQEKLVSALLIGATIEVPRETSIGGTFASIPLCSAGDATGCVIAYASARADAPPPADFLFGSAGTAGMRASCVNPAELDGSAGQLKPHLPSGPILFDELAAPRPWTVDGPPIETPFVSLPGLLNAQCVNRGGFSYLAITVNADPADPRTDTINGDVVVDGRVRAQRGLPLFDMHLAMGNLVDIVGRQSAAWRAAQTAPSTLPPEFHAPN
jgi:hypothetical protein